MDDPAFVVSVMDAAISIVVLWYSEGARCVGDSWPLASTHFQAIGEKSEGQEPLLSHKTVTGWATQQEVFGV